MNSFIDQVHDQHPHCHDDEFSDCGREPSEQEWQVKSQIQFQGNEEHGNREDERIDDHSDPHSFDKMGNRNGNQQGNQGLADTENEVISFHRRKE